MGGRGTVDLLDPQDVGRTVPALDDRLHEPDASLRSGPAPEANSPPRCLAASWWPAQGSRNVTSPRSSARWRAVRSYCEFCPLVV